MSSELSILNRAQKEEFLESYYTRDKISMTTVIMSMLMESVTKHGGPSISELHRTAVWLGGSVTVPNSTYRAVWKPQDISPIHTHFTIGIQTSWDLSTDERAQLERQVLMRVSSDLLPRILFSYGSCDAPDS
ncbi:hypothetical protein PG996_004233 [Apiospora saccharicola]|uniref:Uncharacterized protein n=1 Tax=Apiospora saccharicola TaxID=335842 RepID=A0ABR1W7B7_9PEZI